MKKPIKKAVKKVAPKKHKPTPSKKLCKICWHEISDHGITGCLIRVKKKTHASLNGEGFCECEFCPVKRRGF
jgi:hypothetical protein